MLTVKEIHKFKKSYIDDLYFEAREEQKKDLEYIDDTFTPGVRHPHKILRLGLGADIVNSPAEEIVTSNPQAFVEVSKGNKDAGDRIAKVINGWIDILRRQNPNPFKETVKNKLGRGENYIEVMHNESWVTKPISRQGLPILFLVHDPMVIYGSPAEDDNGIPEKVIVFYSRQPIDLIPKYPHWSNPKKSKKKVEWLGYFDKDNRYFEADGEPVLKEGIQKNLYGFPPFVRKYSGLGRRSPDGELSKLIVSDIRNSRGLIEEICVMESDIMSVLHLSAHKGKTILAAGDVNEEQVRKLEFGVYDINLMQNLGDLSQFRMEDIQVDQPTVQAFTHLAELKAELHRRHPYMMAGFPWGTSGRQQEKTDVAAMRRYETIIENTETEWATAFEMAFDILKAIPTLLPPDLHKGDLSVGFRVTVKLRAKDPIEEDRLITLGDRLRRLPNPAIDLGTFHTEFMGYTQDKSKRVMAKMLADMVTIYNPDVAAVMGMVAAEESGMERWIEQAKEKRLTMEKQQQGLEKVPPATTQERVLGEIETPLGREIGTEGTRGARRSPGRYMREGGR